MKRFLTRALAWFLLPALTLFLLFTAVLYRTGELSAPESWVERTLAGENLVVEPNFLGDFTLWYKSEMACRRSAEVLALGNSRIMQLRGCMLPRADFYNAGGAGNMLGMYLPFLRFLEENGALPSTLILTLDTYYFIDAWANSYDENSVWDYPYVSTPFAQALATTARRYGAGSYTLRQVFSASRRYIGLPACARSSGFGPDGSYYYGTQAEDDAIDLTFVDALGRVQIGSSRFEYADQLAPSTLEMLDRLLAYCDEHSIQVVAFLPPYAPTVYQAMAESGNYGYLDLVYPALCGVFEAHPGQAVFDFTSMPDTTDEMYVDGFHGGDVVYAMILRELAQNSVLGQYTDAETLNALIASAQNPRVILPPAE